MNRKSAKGKQKIADVTKTERPDADSSQRLVIHSRPIIGNDDPAEEPVEGDMASAAPQTLTAPLLAPIKRTSVTVNPANAKSPASEVDKTETEDAEDDEEETDAPKEAEDATQPAGGSPNGKVATAQSDANEKVPAEDTKTAATTASPDTSGATTAQPSQQEIQEAADAVRREREMQEYIKNRQYFVPINAVARKRSVRVSFGLTLLVLLLAVILLDLMLDTGMIYLVQKIPHTHFFNTFSSM